MNPTIAPNITNQAYYFLMFWILLSCWTQPPALLGTVLSSKRGLSSSPWQRHQSTTSLKTLQHNLTGLVNFICFSVFFCCWQIPAGFTCWWCLLILSGCLSGCHGDSYWEGKITGQMNSESHTGGASRQENRLGGGCEVWGFPPIQSKPSSFPPFFMFSENVVCAF